MTEVTTKKNYNISIYLDTRRATNEGKFPVKLRVFTSQPRKQKLFPTKFKFTQDEFDKIWTIRPKKEYKPTKQKIDNVLLHAENVADLLNPFTFEQFEKKLFIKAGDTTRLQYLYKTQIEELTTNRQLNTASTYDLAQKSFGRFCQHKKKKYNTLTLFDIDKKWLNDFESYMTNDLNRSSTTVSMYVRTLRTLFNKAIDEKEINKEFYPFGKRKYQIPATKKVKKALSKQQLSVLFKSNPLNQYQQKAKDLWFFSYACNGMNIKDICLLKYKDISEGRLTFIRAKTKLTRKTDLTPISVHLNDYANHVIELYGSEDKSPENHVFPFLNGITDPIVQRLKIQAFTRFINQHIKKLSVANGLTDEISTYWARHSFATQGIKNGASMAFMQELIGHQSPDTTQKYFAGFDDETKKEFSESLMNFE